MNRRDFLGSLGGLLGSTILGNKIKIDVAEKIIEKSIQQSPPKREMISMNLTDEWKMLGSGSAFCMIPPLWMQQQYWDDNPIRYEDLYGESD